MTKKKTQQLPTGRQYDGLLSSVTDLLQQARRSGARAINAILTATYWEIGRRIVEFEQHGHGKAAYGEEVIDRLAEDLTNRFGRGFGRRNLFQIRAFFLDWGSGYIRQTLSGNSGIVQTASAQSEAVMTPKMQIPSAQFTLEELRDAFPLPYIRRPFRCEPDFGITSVN